MKDNGDELAHPQAVAGNPTAASATKPLPATFLTNIGTPNTTQKKLSGIFDVRLRSSARDLL